MLGSLPAVGACSGNPSGSTADTDFAPVTRALRLRVLLMAVDCTRSVPVICRQGQRQCIFSIFRGNSANADSYLIEILEIYFADL
jgi:hypothetical protein